MVRYLQSRLNDLRDENLMLRDRLKPTNYQHMNTSKNYPETEQYNQLNLHMLKTGCHGMPDDGNVTPSLYTPSLDGESQLETKNELLQQKLNELQKLQMQLNNVQSS